ncbi:MAG: hypothetical protein GY803_00115, partial [Chloroflexi bacterium]|nr:hypothetical protein [Chloroflexota bacterium]
MFFILFCILLSFVMMCSFETALPESASTQATPYPDSPVIADIAWDWDSYVQAAPGSDLWPTTWAADGNIYSSWGDGGGFGG